MFTPVKREDISSDKNYFIAYGPLDKMEETEKMLAQFKGKIEIYYVES